MSDLKYCQGNKCHEYRTKDRIKGTKGSKSYQTREEKILARVKYNNEQVKQ